MTTASQIYFGCRVPIASTIMISTRQFKEKNTPFEAQQSPKMSIFYFLPILIKGNAAKIKIKEPCAAHA